MTIAIITVTIMMMMMIALITIIRLYIAPFPSLSFTVNNALYSKLNAKSINSITIKLNYACCFRFNNT